METVNSSLNTAPRLMIHCLHVAGQIGNIAQLRYACTYARVHTHTHIYILETTHDVLTSECTMYYLTLVGEMDYW